MATNFSPCKGSYVLNQFPSNVMFAMNGFTYQPVERYRAIMALLYCKLDKCHFLTFFSYFFSEFLSDTEKKFGLLPFTLR